MVLEKWEEFLAILEGPAWGSAGPQWDAPIPRVTRTSTDSASTMWQPWAEDAQGI